MFSLQIGRYSMGKLMIKVLIMVRTCEMYKNKGVLGKPSLLEFGQEICQGSQEPAIFENLLSRGGMVTLGTD